MGSWFGVNKLLTKFFYTNSDYNIRHIDTDSGGIFSHEEILAITGLRLGTNIFTINLESARKRLLSLNQMRSATIERVLPNTIRIHLQPKEPIAWLAPEESGADPYTSADSLLLEQGGTSYKPIHLLPTYFTLPVIHGINFHLLAAGDPLETENLHLALELLHRAMARKDPAILLRSLDISAGYCIKALGSTNETIIFSTENFDEQLDRLQELMKICRRTGRQIESANLLVHRNTPVRFVLTLERNSFPLSNGRNIDASSIRQ